MTEPAPTLLFEAEPDADRETSLTRFALTAQVPWRSLTAVLPEYGTADAPFGSSGAGPKSASTYVATTAASSGAEHMAADRAAGYAEGMRQAASEVAERMQRLQASIAQWDGIWEQQVRQTQDDLARLALVMAEQIIMAELPARQNYAARMAQHAVDLFASAPRLRIRLAPGDAAYLRSTQPQLWARAGLVWLEDGTLQAGGLIAECDTGQLDASVTNRLRVMAQTLDLPATPVTP